VKDRSNRDRHTRATGGDLDVKNGERRATATANP
jgi:hypothetical protein